MSGFRPLEARSQGMDNATLTGKDVMKNIGRMFYVVDPAETSFKDLASMPKDGYIQQAMPYFFGMIALEWTILLLKGKMPRLNDGIMSVSHGLIMSLTELLTSGILFSGYMYIYKNHCIYELPWDSTFTWIMAALGIDFCYYWVHRAAHEINLLWAAHQVHHSSEEYNLTTALRQSVFQSFGAWPFYLPMAFFIPPQHAIIHKELNLLYQFWIHTEIVDNLGPLEFILNTSSHHRVHHGANRYCLDKNYAGVLIIWDRLFGTFEAERDDIKIVYGLVDQPQFFNPIKHQLFYYGKVLEKARSMNNWWDYISAFIKGPGWYPGTERLGDITFVDERPVRDVYNPRVNPLLHLYTLTHFAFVIIGADLLARSLQGMEQWTSLMIICYLIGTMTSIGVLYDKSSFRWLAELARCGLGLLYLDTLITVTSISSISLNYLFTGSAVISVAGLIFDMTTNNKQKVN
eukprot:TRINITY_DN2005_c0_g1_i3.p1 TRINITY_DN2005_c0_g1~~TRINITY_DN2005_c0_g1_i3.p1  ORF type:complete len:460 (+),score=113.26 TRINITY_DN2005_c0_g1_i3:50-1429(+)